MDADLGFHLLLCQLSRTRCWSTPGATWRVGSPSSSATPTSTSQPSCGQQPCPDRRRRRGGRCGQAVKVLQDHMVLASNTWGVYAMAPDQGGAKVAPQLILKVHHYRPNLTIWTASSRRLRARRTVFGLGGRYQRDAVLHVALRGEQLAERLLDRGRFWSLAQGLLKVLRSRRVVFALARRAGEDGDDCVLGADARVDRVACSGGVTSGGEVVFGGGEVIVGLLEEGPRGFAARWWPSRDSTLHPRDGSDQRDAIGEDLLDDRFAGVCQAGEVLGGEDEHVAVAA